MSQSKPPPESESPAALQASAPAAGSGAATSSSRAGSPPASPRGGANEPAPPQAGPEAPPPVWKNPFVIAFALGVVFLTVLPLMQRKFLKAPPPVATLGAWSMPVWGGGAVGSAQLRGKVWLASFVPPVCDAACRERFESFGRGVAHVDDLGGKIVLVSFVSPDAQALVAARAPVAGWRLSAGSREDLTGPLFELRRAWEQWAHTDAGTTVDELLALPAIALVDQDGALRGFWRDDTAGRGNSITAARLLARYGTAP